MVHRSANPDIADRLTVVAGPKVYSDLKRSFSSLSLGAHNPDAAEQRRLLG